jgi:hypothetical protein
MPFTTTPNLDHAIIIINNWHVDPHLNCTLNVDLKYYLKVKVGLTKDNYEMIEIAEYFEELQVYED